MPIPGLGWVGDKVPGVGAVPGVGGWFQDNQPEAPQAAANANPVVKTNPDGSFEYANGIKVAANGAVDYSQERKPAQAAAPQAAPQQASLAQPTGGTAGRNYGNAGDTQEFLWQQVISDPALGGKVNADNSVSGVNIEAAVARYNQLHPDAPAQYMGGPSGDRVSFPGMGVVDTKKADETLWFGSPQNKDGSPATGGASGGGGGASLANPGGGGRVSSGPADLGGPTLQGTTGSSSSSYATGQPGDFQFKPWEQKFVAPTDVTEQNDPGYAFRQQQAQLGLEQSAAGRGTALTGGFQKDLAQLNQGLASQEYAAVNKRAQDQYASDYNDFLGNENRRYQAYQGNFGNNLATQQQGLAQQQFGLASNNQAFNQEMGRANLGLATNAQNFGQEFSTNQNQFNQGLALNQNQWGQNLSLATLGQNAASGQNAAAGAYGTNSGNLYTQIGNTNAAGIVGAANANNAGWSNLAGIGNDALAQWQNANNNKNTFTSS
jgi:hypothetical protein